MPAHTIDELERLGREAPEYRPQSDAPPKKSRILSGAEFIARHIPPVWLIDGIVQRADSTPAPRSLATARQPCGCSTPAWSTPAA